MGWGRRRIHRDRGKRSSLSSSVVRFSLLVVDPFVGKVAVIEVEAV